MANHERFDQWVILELMGHRRLAGHLTEQEIAGSGFLRLDIPADAGEGWKATQYYAPGAVYAITPTDESTARLCAAAWVEPPVTEWDLQRLKRLRSADYVPVPRGEVEEPLDDPEADEEA